MGWRLRRSIRIAPGVRLNISKGGIGISAGVKGARIGIGPRGAYTSMSIPGTGLYNITYLGHRKKRDSGDGEQAGSSEVLWPPYTTYRAPGGLGWAILLILAGLVGTAIAFGTSERSWWILGTSIAADGIGLQLLVNYFRSPQRRTWLDLRKAHALMKEDQAVGAARFSEIAYNNWTAEEAHFWAATGLHDTGQHEKALAHFAQVDTSAGVMALAHAESLHHAGRHDEAIEKLQGFAGTEEQQLLALILLAEAFTAKSEYATVVEVYERGPVRKRKMDHTMARLRYGYAIALEATGHERRALRELRKIMAFDATFRDVPERIARLSGMGARETDASDHDEHSEERGRVH